MTKIGVLTKFPFISYKKLHNLDPHIYYVDTLPYSRFWEEFDAYPIINTSKELAVMISYCVHNNNFNNL